jgi:hypothetical protein
LSYGDYVEQLTFLLFLKMADEQSRPPFNKPSPIPKGKDWPALLAKDGDELEIHYRHTLEELGKRSGMLGVIFRKAQNKIQDPAKLRRLIVDLIDKPGPGPGDTWSSLSADVKGDAYEGLLQKNAEDVKGGARLGTTGDRLPRVVRPGEKSPRIASLRTLKPPPFRDTAPIFHRTDIAPTFDGDGGKLPLQRKLHGALSGQFSADSGQGWNEWKC